jgi:hypothetical protein
MSDTILAIDLGRYKSVACVYDIWQRRHWIRSGEKIRRHTARVRKDEPYGDSP